MCTPFRTDYSAVGEDQRDFIAPNFSGQVRWVEIVFRGNPVEGRLRQLSPPEEIDQLFLELDQTARSGYPSHILSIPVANPGMEQ